MPRGLSPFGMPARHPWEIPLLVVVIMITGVAYLLAILLVLVELVAEPVVDAQGQPESGGSLLTSPYVLVLLFAPVLLWAGRGLNFARMRINGVRMSPTQFPEGYRLVQEAAARFGMSKAPDAYVILGNGQINAFASGHGFRRFVVVYSDLFEIGGKAREPDALAFIIGHEVGHIAAGHVSYWRQLGMFVAPYLPILGSSLIRAQEYTADNHGFCNRHLGAPGAMATLAAGKYLNTEVGFDEMADRAATEKGGFVLLVNAMSSHPVLTWRMWALRDRSKPGPMFWHPSPPHPGTIPPPGGYPCKQHPQPTPRNPADPGRLPRCLVRGPGTSTTSA
ncbi:Zn-dependent protease with chaperone function [Nocardia caishijiensis]|uniref:Zn-dependent protease with chaperone function n=2 Tax=Nocardia caishijiensis TaxID=184756 RepID=A0ABQ6YJC6_9NOCA|nr:M48 family metallopeptidase [Nocardia caishijiensis]KAF0845902.1 Zn-dependent protease with chaperone function [Nocardia caishijiensis]